jgi:hypothetical protein
MDMDTEISLVACGSVQQFDYFRQRQLFLDAGAIRRQADNHHLNQLTNPCAK